MKMKYILGSAMALAIGFSGMSANAETFRAATWNGSNSANDKFLRDFAGLAKKGTEGSVDFEVYPGGALLPAKGTLEGIQGGVAQIANITAAYIPAKMPVDFVAADMSFLADDQLALAFAKVETAFFNSQLQKEIKGLDLVFASGFTIGIYNMICSFDAKSIEDFKGKKIRTSSDAQVGFTNAIGGVAVSVPAPEIYTGLQRGTLDCTAGSPLFLTDFFKLKEVAKSVYLISMGSNATGGYYMNKDFWKGRTAKERRVILDSLSEATARSMVQWAANIEKAWVAAKEAGIALNKPEAAAVAKLEEYKKTFVAGLAKTSMEKRGIADPTPLMNEFNANIAKWKKLLAGVDVTSVEQVTALLNKEVYSKLDENTYGLD